MAPGPGSASDRGRVGVQAAMSWMRRQAGLPCAAGGAAAARLHSESQCSDMDAAAAAAAP